MSYARSLVNSPHLRPRVGRRDRVRGAEQACRVPEGRPLLHRTDHRRSSGSRLDQEQSRGRGPARVTGVLVVCRRRVFLFRAPRELRRCGSEQHLLDLEGGAVRQQRTGAAVFLGLPLYLVDRGQALTRAGMMSTERSQTSQAPRSRLVLWARVPRLPNDANEPRAAPQRVGSIRLLARSCADGSLVSAQRRAMAMNSSRYFGQS